MPRKKKIKGKGMKGMTIKGGHKRPTKQGAGLTKAGVAKYRRQNPGSKLQTAVTEKKPTGKRAARRMRQDDMNVPASPQVVQIQLYRELTNDNK